MTNGDKAFYDKKLIVEVSDRQYRSYVDTLYRYFKKYKPLLENYGHTNGNLQCIELGAGSCSVSLFLSKYDFVESIDCFDISTARMKEWSKKANEIIGGKIEKLHFAELDFNNDLPLEDNSVDIVFFDASLHHSRSIWHTLNECYRVCKKEGMVIAQREQFLSLLTLRSKMSSLLETEEVKTGVAENAYLKQQYDYYFKATGFKTKFIPVIESSWQQFIPFLNGILFDKWVIIATK